MNFYRFGRAETTEMRIEKKKRKGTLVDTLEYRHTRKFMFIEASEARSPSIYTKYPRARVYTTYIFMNVMR